MRKNLADLPITEVIHVERDLDLIHSLNPDPKYNGWRFWDYNNRLISESFDSSLAAYDAMILKEIDWRKFVVGKRFDPPTSVHIIASSIQKTNGIYVERAKTEHKTILASIVGEKPANIPENVGIFVVEEGHIKKPNEIKPKKEML